MDTFVPIQCDIEKCFTIRSTEFLLSVKMFD